MLECSEGTEASVQIYVAAVKSSAQKPHGEKNKLNIFYQQKCGWNGATMIS